jgi:hypothetical protein
MRITALSLCVLLSSGCVGVLEPGPGSDPGDEPEVDGDGSGGEPDTAALSAGEVEAAFDAAVAAALAGAAGGTVDDRGASVGLGGSVVAGDAVVSFSGVVLTRTPFAVEGAATVAAGGDSASVTFDGGTTGRIRIDGIEVGSMTAHMPAAFGEVATDTIFNEALDCQGAGLGDLAGGVVTLNDTCTAELGGQVVTITTDVTIDLQNLSVDGTVTVTGDGFDASLVFTGASAELTVNGELVGTFDLGDLLAGLL